MEKVTQELEITKMVREMSPEQYTEYVNLTHEIDIFSREMKIRFAKKMLEGRSGWKDYKLDIPTQIATRTIRLAEGEKSTDIGIANWAFINWYNR